MIEYSKGFLGLPILMRWRGIAWPMGIPPALVSVIVGVFLNEWSTIEDTVSDRTEFMDHPYPFQLYAFIVGFLIVFRTNFAYQRYWEGRSVIAQMASKWLDGACMSVTFDAPGDEDTPYLDAINRCEESPDVFKPRPCREGAQSHAEFVEEILHLFSLMHALALQHLRGDSDLDNLVGVAFQQGKDAGGVPRRCVTTWPQAPPHSGSLGDLRYKTDDYYRRLQFPIIGNITAEEKRCLTQDGHGHQIPTEARVTMVESWIFRRLIARQKHDACDMGITSPPILSRLYQVISDGHIGFGQAAKLVDTPFPFPYQNLLQVFLWIYVFVVPVLMNAWLHNTFLRIGLTFLATWCYFALNEVGCNLEDPYHPYDANELALTYYHWSFNAKCLSYVPIPQKKEHYCIHRRQAEVERERSLPQKTSFFSLPSISSLEIGKKTVWKPMKIFAG